MKRTYRFVALALGVLILSGCSANREQQRQLELIANSRANMLSSELPMDVGPLSILRANANGSVIEIMMVYNDDAQNAKPIQQVLRTSINTYCTNKDIKNNLEVGVSYRIKMRNSRGQLMIDQLITDDTCDAVNP
ncbi:GspS/AspS pilotin family protein [Vibrio sp. AK197]|uniref:GspS/AspS pilotin family protein n=1 Tax=Vibrio olivae TaxID=1243002 RepID=A0ABV5HJG4_9VIBR